MRAFTTFDFPLAGGVLSPFAPSFDDRAHPPLATIASPPLFAPPVEVREEGAALVVVFHVADYGDDELDVEAWGRTLFLFGRRPDPVEGPSGARSVRVFALPFDMIGRALETSRCGDLLRVRIAKKPSSEASQRPVEAAA